MGMLAYSSNESGIEEIYVVSFPTLAVKKQISVGGGHLPRWNQEAIFFLQGNHLVRQKVEARGELVLGKLDVLFETTAFHFDMSPDGKIFYLLEQNKTKDHQDLRLITNWFEDIKIKSEGR
jgi:hypothetical protein